MLGIENIVLEGENGDCDNKDEGPLMESFRLCDIGRLKLTDEPRLWAIDGDSVDSGCESIDAWRRLGVEALRL